ncbi:hypothetical protein [Thermostaphylospora chromogena]|uniref:hypothetical protein n=1 Tax=Thermostaphylospora chromogena TaxID=35622 RepID=UPI001F60A7A2|nr:hypothetical protein [Thermostaphylospora chromogena]
MLRRDRVLEVLRPEVGEVPGSGLVGEVRHPATGALGAARHPDTGALGAARHADGCPADGGPADGWPAGEEGADGDAFGCCPTAGCPEPAAEGWEGYACGYPPCGPLGPYPGYPPGADPPCGCPGGNCHADGALGTEEPPGRPAGCCIGAFPQVSQYPSCTVPVQPG